MDNDEVFAKINEKAESGDQHHNRRQFANWGEYEQKCPLIFASGEIGTSFIRAD